MKQKTIKEHVSEADVLEEVHFKIDKEAFKGPFPCCNAMTKKQRKKISHKGVTIDYEVWHCPKCGKDYLDTDNATKLENFWMIEKLLNNKLITMERTINYDGKMYFIRFPKDLSKHWEKGSRADIKLLTPEKFLIEIKS